MKEVPIGVMALQGDFAAHARAIEAVGGRAIEVRRPEQLAETRGLILPGGESTTLMQLITEFGFANAIADYNAQGRMICGVCAGLILLAREVLDPPQDSLGLLDVTVQRNAYGRQVDSFVGTGTVSFNGGPTEQAEMIFIRAPRIVRLGNGVEVVGELNGEATFVRQGSIWAGTFHPELSDPPWMFTRLVAAALV